jgi:PBSX family phage terminase large subunit
MWKIKDDIELTERQREFVEKVLGTSEFQFLLLGGYGAGKTTVCSYIVLQILRIGGTKCLITRETERNIFNTLLPTILAVSTQPEREYMIEHKNEKDGVVIHPAGSELYILSSGELRKQFEKIKGYEFNCVFVDEASLLSEDAYLEIIRRIRRPPIQKLILAATASDVGYEHWLYKRFAGREFRIRTIDNPYLPQSYLENLRQTHGEEELKSILGEGWGSVKKNNTYNLTEENIWRPTPDELRRKLLKWTHDRMFYGGIDWGVANMAVVLGVWDVDEEIFYFLWSWEYTNENLLNIASDLKKELEKWGIRYNEVYFVGDIGGKRKDWRGQSAFEIFTDAGFNVVHMTPPLLESFQKENFYLGRRKIKIFHKAQRIIASYEGAYEIKGDKLEKKSELEHIKDACRYVAYYFFSGGGKITGYVPGYKL